MSIHIQPATLADYPTIQNMARFYVYDRTRYMGWECPVDGLFECIDFRHYFESSDKKAFLVKVGNELAGFVLLDKEPDGWNMGEFFILAKFQGKGVGGYVVGEILRTHPGKWSVAVMPENVKAVRFWHKIITNAVGSNYISKLKEAENDDAYTMQVFFFETGLYIRWGE